MEATIARRPLVILAILVFVLATIVVGHELWRVQQRADASTIRAEFAAAAPPNSTREDIVRYLDGKRIPHADIRADSIDSLVTDNGIPLGSSIVAASVHQDGSWFVLRPREIVVYFAMSEDDRLERIVSATRIIE